MKKLIILLCLVLTTVCFSANEIHYFDTTGQTTLYARVIKASDLTVWETVAGAYQASPTWANTDIALTEQGTDYRPGCYVASMPTSAGGKYYIEIYDQAGATLAATDTRLEVYELVWTGTAEHLPYNVLQVEGADITTYVESRTLATADYLTAADVWNALTSGMTTSCSIGKKLADFTLGTDNKVLISADSQDLSATLKVKSGGRLN